MNKRGQMYILAAIVLSIAIFGVMKVTNQFVAPPSDNFDFYVENLEGEKSYVMNLGLLVPELNNPGEENTLLKTSGGGLLEMFQQFGINTGIVLIEKSGTGWSVSNFLGEDNFVEAQGDCEDCESFSVPSMDPNLAEVSFSVNKGGKRWLAGEGWAPPSNGDTYYSKEFTGNILTLDINGNPYVFDSDSKNVEALIFKNIAKNYVKVMNI
jgi:hypothetical protein